MKKKNLKNELDLKDKKMKTTPKLQATLEVFFDKFEEMEQTLKQTQEIIPALDKRIQIINNAEIPVNITEFEVGVRELQNTNERNLRKLKQIAETHEKKIAKASAKAQSFQYYFYIALLVAFATTVSSFLYAENKRNKLKELQTKNKHYQHQIQKANQFLNEKNLIEDFKEWDRGG